MKHTVNIYQEKTLTAQDSDSNVTILFFLFALLISDFMQFFDNNNVDVEALHMKFSLTEHFFFMIKFLSLFCPQYWKLIKKERRKKHQKVTPVLAYKCKIRLGFF